LDWDSNLVCIATTRRGSTSFFDRSLYQWFKRNPDLAYDHDKTRTAGFVVGFFSTAVVNAR
jgi:hypothetical protein